VRVTTELAEHVGVKPACSALGVSRATFYRRRRPTTGHQLPRPTPARALSKQEQDEVYETLCSPRFVDRSPAEVKATLLDEGVYQCSERTMYRVLASRAPIRERRAQRTHPEYKKPELMATGPNQVWSWDITRLLGPKKWSYYYLYVILDIFSRYSPGWMVADRENSALAGRLIQQTCLKHGVQPQVLTLHSDRGAPMTSQCTAQLLADLGVTRSLSRPQVSDDNPFSEAQFKTLKYHPSFPGRFDDQNQAKGFCRSFFRWYNTEHRHGGISMLTPEQVHFGHADEIISRRKAVLRDAWADHPERFVSGQPKTQPLPEAVWINPPDPATLSSQEIAL
jgi:putative transposase